MLASLVVAAAAAAESVDPAVASLAAAYGSSVPEADARSAWQHRAGDLQPEVTAGWETRSAGMWTSQAERAGEADPMSM